MLIEDRSKFKINPITGMSKPYTVHYNLHTSHLDDSRRADGGVSRGDKLGDDHFGVFGSSLHLLPTPTVTLQSTAPIYVYCLGDSGIYLAPLQAQKSKLKATQSQQLQAEKGQKQDTPHPATHLNRMFCGMLGNWDHRSPHALHVHSK